MIDKYRAAVDAMVRTVQKLLISLMIFASVPSMGSAQLLGPVNPPPLGAVFSQTGSPHDGLWGWPGGKDYFFSNVNHANNTPVFWGVASGGVRLSLDGGDFSAPGEVMSFDPVLSDLPNGVVAWSGQTTIVTENSGPQTAYTRFHVTIVDGVTKAPVALTLATDEGLPDDVGGIFEVVNSAAAFDVNLLFSASLDPAGPFTPHLAFFDPLTGFDQDGMAHSSLVSGFYYVNTPPFMTAINNLVINEGDSITVGSTKLMADDYESGPDGLTYTLNPEDQGGVPQHGVLYRDGVALGTNDTFTQTDVNSDLISYAHDGSETTYDSYNFTVHDEQGAIAQDGPFTLFKNSINITTLNDPPTTVAGNGLANIDGTFFGQFEGNDEEDDALVFSVVGADAGSAQIIDEDAGLFSYSAPEGFVGDTTIQFQVWDGEYFAAAAGEFIVTVPDPQLAVLNVGDLLIANGDKLILHNLPDNTNWVLSSGNHFTNLNAITFDGENGLYVMDRANGLIRVDPVTGDQTVIAGGEHFSGEGPGSIAAISPSHVLVTNLDFVGGTSLLKVDTTSGAVTILSQGNLIPVPTATAVGGDGRVFVADASMFSGGTSGLAEIDPLNGAQTGISLGGFLAVPFGIAVENNQAVVIADAPAEVGNGANADAGVGVGPINRVLRISTVGDAAPGSGPQALPPVLGEQTILTDGGPLLDGLSDITVGYNGKIYIANGSNVVEIDPVTGIPTIVPTEPVVDRPSDVLVYFKDGIFSDSFEGGAPDPE